MILAPDALNWDTDDTVLTGMRTADADVYRYTVREADVTSVLSTCPARFSVSGKTRVPVAGGQFYEMPDDGVSASGYWIVVPR